MVDTTNGDNRTCQFHTIYDNTRYVITASYNKKRKLIELRCGKKKEVFRGKHLTDPTLFPLKMQDDELAWKLRLNYIVQTDKFALYINEIAFLAYPYQAEITHTGPQNIDSGRIMTNGQTVHEGFA